MDARLLDVIISVICFCILIMLLGFLPIVMEEPVRVPHPQFLSSFSHFYGAGYLVNKQIA